MRTWGWAAVLAALLPACAAAASMERGISLKKAGKLAEAAEVFQEVVREDLRDADALEQLATVQGWLGRYEDSVKTWVRALKLRPDSPDTLTGLARVLYWKHDYRRALGFVEKALVQAPGSVDALVLKGDVLAAEGDVPAARAAYLDARAVAPNDAELGKKLERLAEPLRFRVDVGYIHDRYGNFRGREYSAYGQVGYSFNRTDNVWFRADYMRYFRSVDRMFQIGGAVRPHRLLLLLPSVGGTSKPNFRPNSQAELGLESPILAWLTPLLNYRYFHYPNGDVRLYVPGVRIAPVAWGNLEYRYGISKNVDRTTTNSWSLKGSAFLGRYSPYVGYADGVEDLPPQNSAKVTYYSAGCVVDVSRRWGFRLDYTYEDRPAFYQHHSEGAGITFRF